MRLLTLGFFGLAALVLLLAFIPAPTAQPLQPCPDCPVGPQPVNPTPPVEPQPEPCPRRPRKPCPCPRALLSCDLAGVTVGGPIAPDGTEVQFDLPASQHQRNTGGVDGAGLCVFASLRHTGRWHSDPVFSGLFDYMKTQPGGGYPAKVDRVVKDYAAKTGKPVPAYMHAETNDWSVIEKACAAGLMPGITYRYNGQGQTNHMVTVLSCDSKWVCILDNNRPGKCEWLTRDEARQYCGDPPDGRFWAVIPLLTPVPPPPHN